MYFKLVSLRKYGNSGSRCVHAPLCLCGRHALYTVDPRFVFQCAIDVGTTDCKVNLLETTNSALRDTGDRELPALRLAVALVHLEQVASKERSLVATRSCTNFHLHVLGVFRVFRNERYLDFLLQFGLQGLVLRQLLTSHLLHLRVSLVGQDILGFADAVQTGDVTLAGIHNVTQVFIFLRQFHEAVLVCYHVRVGDERRHLFKACLQTVEFL